MDITIHPGKLQGEISVIPSKSQAHRLLICAAFSDAVTTLICRETSQDIEATAACLNALGASISYHDGKYVVTPVRTIPQSAVLDCGESGSTLRFLLPIVGALGVNTTFVMHGRLPNRPLSPLWEEMIRMGCGLSRPTANTIQCSGKLSSGQYFIDGSVSSQFISGLLFAAALMDGPSKINITGSVESLPYIELTQSALAQFGILTEGFEISGKQTLHSPRTVFVEGDWSNGAFFVAANALGSSIQIENLDEHSMQGDRAVLEIIPQLAAFCTVSAANIPDLVPILAVVASANCGGAFTDIRRLRLKESDRVDSVAQMLHSLGGCVETEENKIIVHPALLRGGTVDAQGDHRIAMAAAIAATASSDPVTILGAECVSKSYPGFWNEYRKLGGNYEQYIR